MTAARRTAGIVLAIMGLLMLAVTLTVPMVASGGPAIIAAILFGAAWVVWP